MYNAFNRPRGGPGVGLGQTNLPEFWMIPRLCFLSLRSAVSILASCFTSAYVATLSLSRTCLARLLGRGFGTVQQWFARSPMGVIPEQASAMRCTPPESDPGCGKVQTAQGQVRLSTQLHYNRGTCSSPGTKQNESGLALVASGLWFSARLLEGLCADSLA
ncbi:hypothetical protein VTK56DRAFT_5574 [Thermocarpiscus australiensis]